MNETQNDAIITVQKSIRRLEAEVRSFKKLLVEGTLTYSSKTRIDVI